MITSEARSELKDLAKRLQYYDDDDDDDDDDDEEKDNCHNKVMLLCM